ncbi:MAG: peroxiredoxin [Candidatus Thiodiazotropha sp. (ex Codakia rugifera)]|nr:peroxiredoxin [Candidatus Thiodiazotropha sp. (ex Codakia rugifera)]
MSRLLPIVVTISAIFPFGQVENHIVVGKSAPDFHMMDQNGIAHRLSDYNGRWLVLYFYPRDDTPRCTIEACDFRDNQDRFNKEGVSILGVSMNSLSSHQMFTKKYGLPFPILSDTSGQTAKAYGSLFQFGPLKFAKRHSFIIDPEGNIAAIFREVDPQCHTDKIFEELRLLSCSKDIFN